MAQLSPKDRMVTAALMLFQRKGYAAASWRKLVEAADAPWGSAHHYFPGGKEQLSVAAIELGGRGIAALIEHSFREAGSAADGVRRLFAASAAQMVRSKFQSGCPITTVALETVPSSSAITAACRAAFALWEETLANGLRRSGVEEDRVSNLAMTILATFEGAPVTSRVSQSVEPLRVSAETVARLLA